MNPFRRQKLRRGMPASSILRVSDAVFAYMVGHERALVAAELDAAMIRACRSIGFEPDPFELRLINNTCQVELRSHEEALRREIEALPVAGSMQ